MLYLLKWTKKYNIWQSVIRKCQNILNYVRSFCEIAFVSKEQEPPFPRNENVSFVIFAIVSSSNWGRFHPQIEAVVVLSRIMALLMEILQISRPIKTDKRYFELKNSPVSFRRIFELPAW